MIVYADALIVINFILTGLILSVTAFLCQKKIHWIRLFMGALLASVYALGEVLPDLRFLYLPLEKIFFSWILISVPFSVRSFKEWFKLIVIFYMVSFVFGGAVFGWMYLFEVAPNSVVSIMAGAILACSIFWLTQSYLLKKANQRQSLEVFDIGFLGQKKTFTGLIDTGNGLYSLWSRKPVIILELKSAIQIMPISMQNWLKNSGKIEDLTILDLDEWGKRLEQVPFRGVGQQEKQWLWAFRPDFLYFRNTANNYASECLVGLTESTLNFDGSYQALLHPDLQPNNSKRKEA